MEDTTDQLAAIERLVIASAVHNDQRDWPQLAELFTKDATVSRPSGDVVAGRDAIQESYAQRPANRRTRHVCSNILVTLGDATANVYTSVLLFTWEIGDSPDGLPSAVGPLIGEFIDEVDLGDDGTWRISKREGTLSAKADRAGG